MRKTVQKPGYMKKPVSKVVMKTSITYWYSSTKKKFC